MRTGRTRLALSAVAIAALVVLAGCGSLVFDPTGTYVGTIAGVPGTATITSTFAANTWDLNVTLPGPTYTGSCSHDPNGVTGNLYCVFGGGFGVLDGSLNGNTYQGTYTASGSPMGPFTLIRP